MFTRRKAYLPPLTNDWKIDGPRLYLALQEYWRALEEKNALRIGQAQIAVDQGLQFPATQVASSDANNLDDYEEGSGTLTVTFVTPGTSSFVSSENNYTYTKVGREVLFRYNVVGTITIGTGSGVLLLTGLPFTSANVTSNYAVGAVLWGDAITKAGGQMSALMPPNNASIQFAWSLSGAAAASVVAADITTGSTLRLRGCLTFHV